MLKRVLCLLTVVCLMLTLVPAFAEPASAVTTMTTSENCIEMLKGLEGFHKKPVFDNGHYSVGYGSSCKKDEYPNGITKEEADALLRVKLADMEVTVNNFAKKYQVVLSQPQFDALMLFTYNIGGNWVLSDGLLRQAIISGKTGNDFIYAMTLWSNASAKLNMGLVDRRLAEANLYLNGNYSSNKPSNFTYVILDSNGGVSDAKVQGFDCNLPAYMIPEPTKTGAKFLGWYTAKEGGAWVTELTSANAEQTLYAHWQEGSGDPTKGVSSNYYVNGGELADNLVYDKPGGNPIGRIKQDARVPVTADYVDANGVKWGKAIVNLWVRLGNPLTGDVPQEEPETGEEVTITGDYVNVRSGPSEDYKVVAKVVRGDKLVITETTQVGDNLWGKCRAGWINLEYTSYQGTVPPTTEPEETTEPAETTAPEETTEPAETTAPEETTEPAETTAPEETTEPTETTAPEESTKPTEPPKPEEDPVIAAGTVTANRLNIRASAGTAGYLMGCYENGTKVEILEKAMVNGTFWGRTKKGWICLTYVKLDQAQTENNQPTNPTQPEQNQPAQPENTTGIVGIVTSRSGLNIRKAPGTASASVGSYPSGAQVRILEQKLNAGVIWGRTDKGWISMNYVKLNAASGGTISSGVTGTVTASGLHVRKGPGTTYASQGHYPGGTTIQILEMTKVGTVTWGRTDKGWVCMSYVNLNQNSGNVPSVPETTPPATNPPATTPEDTKPQENPKPEQSAPAGSATGVVTAAGGLNVRASASTTAGVVGGYARGDKVTILEQTRVNGTVWGRTSKGWICLSYVRLDTTASGSTVAGYSVTVTATHLMIRKGAGTANPSMGTYQRGDVITILETVKVGTSTWGRTDKGWVCMDYVK